MSFRSMLKQYLDRRPDEQAERMAKEDVQVIVSEKELTGEKATQEILHRMLDELIAIRKKLE